MGACYYLRSIETRGIVKSSQYRNSRYEDFFIEEKIIVTFQGMPKADLYLFTVEALKMLIYIYIYYFPVFIAKGCCFCIGLLLICWVSHVTPCVFIDKQIRRYSVFMKSLDEYIYIFILHRLF